MDQLLATIPAAVVVFAATNIDDLVVLTFFFMATRESGGTPAWKLIAGQAAGVAVLVASAAIAAIGLLIVPAHWAGLLGLFPLGLGCWRLLATFRKTPERDAPPPATAGFGAVAAVAIVNGADNLTIYTPLLRTLSTGQVVVTLIIFAAMIGLWCAAAAWLASRLAAVTAIRRYSHRLVPIALIVIGAIILTHWAIS
jgi:cadmium resistance protein CadD (predicted permease)